MSGKNIKRYTIAELRELSRQGASRTDLGRLRALSDEDAEHAATINPEEAGLPSDWYKQAEAVTSRSKIPVSIRLDADIVDSFKSRGRGWQTQMNAVLRAYLNASGSSR